MSPLQCAIILQTLPIIKLLIEKGANPYIKDKQGINCFEEAVESEEILEVLKETKCLPLPEKKEESKLI